MAQIFQFLLAGGDGSGEKVLCFHEDWLSHSISLCGGKRGRESTGLLLLCFLVIRSLPFQHRPIGKRNAQHDDNGGHPHSGDSQQQVLAMRYSGDQWVHLYSQR